MLISKTVAGLNLYFTKEERRMIPVPTPDGRVQTSVHAHSETEFVRIQMKITNDAVSQRIRSQIRSKAHPYLLHLPNRNFQSESVGLFGPEEVDLRNVGDGVFVVKKPTMQVPAVIRVMKKTGARSRPINLPAPTYPVGSYMDLDTAVKHVNEHKKSLRDQLVLEISPNGFLKALVQFGME